MKKVISSILVLLIVLIVSFGNCKKMYGAEVNEKDKYYEQVLSFLDKQKQNINEKSIRYTKSCVACYKGAEFHTLQNFLNVL